MVILFCTQYLQEMAMNSTYSFYSVYSFSIIPSDSSFKNNYLDYLELDSKDFDLISITLLHSFNI